MIEISITGLAGTEVRSFVRSDVIVGRAPDVDVLLDRPDVAPRHLRLGKRGNELRVYDLRHPTREWVVLEPNDVVRIGVFDLRGRTCSAIAETAPEGDALLAVLREDPSNGEVREIYADWLEQRGDLARGEFLRAQRAASNAGEALDPRVIVARARLSALSRSVGEGWRALVALSSIERCQRRSQPAVELDRVCPMRWERLASTDRDDVRWCDACNSQVTYCATVEDARVVAEAGGCVALDPVVPRKPHDLDPRPAVGRPRRV